MKDKSTIAFLIIVIWAVCFAISDLSGSYDYMYAAVAATLFILLGSI